MAGTVVQYREDDVAARSRQPGDAEGNEGVSQRPGFRFQIQHQPRRGERGLFLFEVPSCPGLSSVKLFLFCAKQCKKTL